MRNSELKWEVLHKRNVSRKGDASRQLDVIIDVLLKNRELKSKKEKEEFFNPTQPSKMPLRSLSLKQKEINKAIVRIKKAIKDQEIIIIYGDYDADGICATAILWEVLYSTNKNTVPYIPDRFSEGYGLNAETIEKLKVQNPDLTLIITVDNGIVAGESVDVANKLGIDVIITDHHQKGKKLPKAQAIIHTDKIGGAGLAWVLAREISKQLKSLRYKKIKNSLDLAAIGTIADQLPLIGSNRSFAKYGLESLNSTKRSGLLALFKEAGIKKGQVGTYEVGYIIAPRINAMGRLKHAMDSLRLLCTKNKVRAENLARLLGKTNTERQKIVEKIVLHARERAKDIEWKGAIVLAHESYHEGVIGLAASKLVEEFYRPAIVLSRGELHSKASARSISGFNIIEAIRKLEHLTEGGGGHPMAAGFTIKSSHIDIFSKKFEEVSSSLLTDEVFKKRLKIDLEIEFDQINRRLIKRLLAFEPSGVGNPRPTFMTKNTSLLNARTVGAEGKHLKLKLERNDKVFDAIAFGFGDYYQRLLPQKTIDVVYNIEENEWGGRKTLELKIKDIKFDGCQSV
jgi:single-stranded-DNA-specific exonuclease